MESTTDPALPAGVAGARRRALALPALTLTLMTLPRISAAVPRLAQLNEQKREG